MQWISQPWGQNGAGNEVPLILLLMLPTRSLPHVAALSTSPQPPPSLLLSWLDSGVQNMLLATCNWPLNILALLHPLHHVIRCIQVETSIRKIKEEPGRAMMVGGAVLLALGMIIGPAVAAASLAFAGLSITVASSMAFGAVMIAFSMAFGAVALGIFGGFALPLLAPSIITLAVVFIGMRTFLKSSSSEAESTAGQASVDPKVAAKEEERSKREREEEERQREIEQELKDFDDLLSKKKRN